MKRKKNMSAEDKKFYQEVDKEFAIEEWYKQNYVPEELNVGDRVRIMVCMLGNGQFGNITEVRDCGVKGKRYSVQIDKGNVLLFKAEELLKAPEVCSILR